MADSEVADALRRLSRRAIVVASRFHSGTHPAIDAFRKQFRKCRSWKWWGENFTRLYPSLKALFEPTPLSPIGEAKVPRVRRRVPRSLAKARFPPEPGAPGGEIALLELDYESSAAWAESRPS